MAELHISGHAVERYIERVRPGTDFDEAKAALDLLLSTIAVATTDRGWWSMCRPTSRRARTWLVVEGPPAFAAAVKGAYVLTVVTPEQVHAQIEFPTTPERSTAA